jgi:Gas vesicle synthesis protein GvpO
MADPKQGEGGRGAMEGVRRLAQRKPSLVQLAERTRRELVQITGLQPEGVTSLEPRDDGIWKVTIELLEFSRIPNTDDVLGTYEASVDATGELLGYRRVRRYARSRSLQEQGSL